MNNNTQQDPNSTLYVRINRDGLEFYANGPAYAVLDLYDRETERLDAPPATGPDTPAVVNVHPWMVSSLDDMAKSEPEAQPKPEPWVEVSEQAPKKRGPKPVIDPVLTKSGRLNVAATLRSMEIGEVATFPAVMVCPHRAAHKAGIKIKTQRKGNKRIVERVS